MTKMDEEILASIGMTVEEADAISKACEEGDYSMWDSSRVSYGSPFEEEMTTISVRIPQSRVEAMKRAAERHGVSRSEYVRRAIDQELIAEAM